MADQSSHPAVNGRFRGVVVPDPRITGLWAAHSTHSQAGPRPGVPVPQQDTDMVLEATGEQSADKELRIRTQRAGMGRPNGGGFVWRYDGDTDWRGSDVYNVITGWKGLVWTAGAGDPYAADQAGAIALSTGAILCAYRRQTGAGPVHAVYVAKRHRASGAWVHYEVRQYGGERESHPCLVELPDGRVLCFSMVLDTEADELNVQAHVSDDEGETWSFWQPWCLRSGISQATANPGSAGFDAQRMRCAYANGTILLVISARSRNSSLVDDGSRGGIFQFASDDLGASFDLIEQVGPLDETTDIGRCEVLAVKGQFQAYYLTEANGQLPTYRVLGSAYQPFSTAAAVSVLLSIPNGDWDDVTHTTGDFAACLDEDGIIYVFGRMTDNAYGHHIALRSRDDGRTWAGMGQSSIDAAGTLFVSVGTMGHWFYNGAAGAEPYPTQICAVAGLGSAWIFCNNSSGASSYDDSLGVIQLGGYSTVTMPGRRQFPTDSRRVGWEVNYLPFEVPESSGWSATGAGAGVITSVDGALDIGTTAATRYYSRTPVGNTQEGIIVLATVAVPVGGALTAPAVGILIQTDDGSADYSVSVNFTTTGFRAQDVNNASATIGSDVTCNMISGIQILIEVRGNDLNIWYREGVDPASDREWTAAQSSGALTDGGGSTANLIRFGHIGSSTSNSNWYGVHYVTDEYTGVGLDGWTNPDDLFARTLSTSPQSVDDGVRIAAIDGPAGFGDRWEIDTRYDYPAERVQPWVAPSPRATHRTTEDSADVYYAWDIGLNTAGQLNAVYAVYIGAANWRYGDVEVLSSAGGAWSNVTAVDMATDLASLPFTRNGNALIPSATSNTAARYIAAGELVGCTVDIGSSVLRKVLWNSEGYWTDTAGQKKPTVILEEVDHGADPTTGTCSIWSRNAVVIVHKLGNVRGVRLKVRAQDTVEEYLETGVAFPGPIVVFGMPPGWGRIRMLDANAALVEAEDGSRRSKVLGPPRRSFEFGWPDGVDMRAMQGEGSTPFDDFVLGTTTGATIPIAAWSDVPLLLEGLLRRLDGPHRPCVYLPRIPQGTPDAVVYTSPERYLYGRLESSVVAPGVQGEEDFDEVVRVDPIRIVEEV